MILYNETINIDAAVETEWLAWMTSEHVPDVMATGLPVSHKALRLLTEIDNGGVTYTFQYYFRTMDDYLVYQNEHAHGLHARVAERYPNKYVTFRTLLEEL